MATTVLDPPTTEEIDPLTGKPRVVAPVASAPPPAPNAAPASPGATNDSTVYKPMGSLVTAPPPAPGVAAAPAAPKADLATGNANVLAEAQNRALNSPLAPTLGLTTEKTQSLLNDPNQGFDPNAFRQLQEDKFNREQAQLFERVREGTAPIAGSGRQQAIMQNQAMDQSAQRGEFGTQLGLTLADKQKQNLMDALGQGRQQSQLESGIGTQGINNLLGTRAGFEGEAQRGFAASSQLLDIGAQKDIEGMRQKWATGERVSTEEYQKNAQSIDNALKLAMQNNDHAATKELQGIKIQADATQAGLDKDFQKLMQGLSFEGQEKLIKAKGEIDATLMGKSQGYNLQLQDIQQQYAIALQRGDQQGAQELAKLGNALQIKRDEAQNQFTKDMAQFDATTQEHLLGVKAEIDKGNLVDERTWKGAQADLDRELTKAMAENDFVKQTKLMELKGQLDKDMQKSQNEFADSQRVATQGWQTGERLSDAEIQKGFKYLDYQQAQALQANDIAAQDRIATNRNNLELTMQTNSMNFDERMTFIKSKLDEAKANKDYGRQRDLIGYQATTQLNADTIKNGWDVAKQNSQNSFNLLMQTRDFTQANQVLKSTQNFQAQENAKDRFIHDAQLKLQEKGVNMQDWQTKYNAIQDAVEAGNADPSSLTDFINGALKTSGIQLTPPDPEAVNKAFDEDWTNTLRQYALTHPGDVTTEKTDGAIDLGGGKFLSTEGQGNFNTFYNKTTYGSDTAAGGATAGEAELANLPKLTMSDPASIQSSFGKEVNWNGQKITVGQPKTYMMGDTAHLGLTFTASDGSQHWIDLQDGSTHKA